MIFLAGDHFAPNPAQAVHAFCHALPGRWHQMSVMLSAAAGLRWVTQLLGQPDEASLLALVAGLDDGRRARAPVFLPYLQGERTPHNDAQAQGVFFGLHGGHGPADLGQAVIEGVAFGLADGWRALAAQPGAHGSGPAVQALSLVGGGARSPLWAQLLADVLQLPLHTHAGGEAGGALGAARLGWLADLGAQGLADDAAIAHVCVRPTVARRFEPDAAAWAWLAPRQARYRALYPALKPHFA